MNYYELFWLANLKNKSPSVKIDQGTNNYQGASTKRSITPVRGKTHYLSNKKKIS